MPATARSKWWSGAPKRRPSRSAIGRAPIATMSRRIPPTPVAAPWNGSTADGWLWLSTLKATAWPSPRSTTPAFSPGPWSTRAPGRSAAGEQQRRVLVAAVLRPEQREDGELEVVRLAPEQLADAVELPVGQPERAVERLFGDRRQMADPRWPLAVPGPVDESAQCLGGRLTPVPGTVTKGARTVTDRSGPIVRLPAAVEGSFQCLAPGRDGAGRAARVATICPGRHERRGRSHTYGLTGVSGRMSRRHLLMLLALSRSGERRFMFIKVAVRELEPSTLIAGRARARRR